MLNNNLDYSIDTITEQLCRLAEGYNREPDEQTINETEYAIYQLKAMAENPYNNDCWRTLWKVLQNITNYEWEENSK